MIRGLGVSPGIAYGKALVLDARKPTLIRRTIKKNQAEKEIRRLKKAIDEARSELEILNKRVRDELALDQSQIFEAHLMMLNDPSLIGQIVETIRTDLVVAEWAVHEIIKKTCLAFRQVDDQYLRERGADVEDVGDRILHRLTGKGFDPNELPAIEEDSIVVATSLSPSQTVSFNKKKVIGFAVELGGPTSHAAIIAKSLQMPAVLGLRHVTSRVKTGDMVILDGNDGSVIINPGASVVTEYRNKEDKYRSYARELLTLRDLPSETLDGFNVNLRANIELVEEMESAGKNGSLGVGLYRSEFLFLKYSPRLPTEEEHYSVYREIAESADPHFAVIRTLDLGGEKFFHEVLEHEEMNPVMGLRAIRLCLKRKDIFRTQLRAILRAGLHGKLRLMFPLISGVRELRVAKMLLDEVKEELHREGIAFDENMKIGIMIEVPSAATIADLLAREVDFFSIGTNDLIQYFLATDRSNESISYLYTPLHPAILRTLKGVVDAAFDAGIEVSMCGEMASDPLYVLILLGLGIPDLSMNPTSIPIIKNVIRSVRHREARSLVKKIFTLSTEQEIKEYVLETMIYKFPEGFICYLH